MLSRLSMSLVVGMLCLQTAPSGSAQASKGAGSESITLVDGGNVGAARAVDGIVCDNLRSTPPDQRNSLIIMIPASVAAETANCRLSNPDGTQTDSAGHNNVGTVSVSGGRLVYYPPDEFNSIQEPDSAKQVDGPATRRVLLTIQRSAANGGGRAFPPKAIVLARPPAILVHGINSGPDSWLPFVRAIAGRTGADEKRLEFPFTTLDHFRPAEVDGVSLRNREQFPEGLFAGCGPVELGAALLSRQIQQTLTRVRRGAPLPLLESEASTHDAPFIYRAPDGKFSRPLRLAIRRVDVVTISYGGTISRWYIASNGSVYPGQAAWYHNRYLVKGKSGRPMDLFPRVRYRGDVRKLITIGGFWRGVPLNNYLAEIRFPQPGDPKPLARAPLRFPQWMPKSMLKQIGPNRTMSGLVQTINATLKLNSPASEVCAVESPWLQALTYGTSDSKLQAPASPFREEIAYGSVGGDDSAYFDFGPVKGISLYGAALFFQRPSHFPFHLLERRSGSSGSFSPLIGSVGDYSDGLVPLWSSLIPGTLPGASQIVGASHSTYVFNREAREYVERWLNDAALPAGKELLPHWNAGVVSRGSRKRWDFQVGEMAPLNLTGLYARINGVARITPGALHPDRSIVIRPLEEGSMSVSWAVPAGGRLRQVTLYEGRREPDGSGSQRAKRVRTVPASVADGQYTSTLTGLARELDYFIIAEAIVENSPDQPVIIQSRAIPFSAGAVSTPGIIGPRAK